MKGVLEEAPEVLEETKNGPVRDAALISACQRVEHYEMAGYGSAREFAKLLGLREIATLLDETLTEERMLTRHLRWHRSRSTREPSRKGDPFDHFC
jgi:ferritin-like metal-binding protein YciE